jgi:hypothetical protein
MGNRRGIHSQAQPAPGRFLLAERIGSFRFHSVVSPSARISPATNCGTGTPACKVNVNDSDHTYFGMWNDTADQPELCVGERHRRELGDLHGSVLDLWSSGNRNLCQNLVNGVCSGVDTCWDNLRNNLGYTLSYANKMDLAKMTAHASLSSTGYCLAQRPATGAEYLVYAPNGGSFTVDLGAMVPSRTLNVEWFDPSMGTTTAGGTVSAGSVQPLRRLLRLPRCGALSG